VTAIGDLMLYESFGLPCTLSSRWKWRRWNCKDDKSPAVWRRRLLTRPASTSSLRS